MHAPRVKVFDLKPYHTITGVLVNLAKRRTPKEMCPNIIAIGVCVITLESNAIEHTKKTLLAKLRVVDISKKTVQRKRKENGDDAGSGFGAGSRTRERNKHSNGLTTRLDH